MSNWIFDPTSLPGFKRLHRQPLQKTVTQRIDSGKEARISKYLTQRWRYEPEFELLRSSTTFLELQKILGFFTRHAGRRDNFLLLDPEDNAVTDHGFGVGDGTTTTFQLQRTLLAGTLTQDALGSWDTYTKPRTNLILQSQAFDNGAWTKFTGVTATADLAIAPDGTLTADRLVYDGSGSAGAARLSQGVGIPSNGQSRVSSLWVRADAPVTLRVDSNLAGGSGVQTIAITTVWQRFSAWGIGDGITTAQLTMYSPGGVNSTFTVYLWGAQHETGTTPSQYIATTTAAVRDDPAYWPSAADGFEPVTEPQWPTVTFYKDGVAQSSWTPGAGGQVTFPSAPAAGAALSWTGSFWRRVRIDDDEPRFEQIMPGRFRGPFEMISVI